MKTAPLPTRMPTLPRPGQRVRWRQPRRARAWSWARLYGSGPFEVVCITDHSSQGLAAGVVVRTKIGEAEISEVWLALADEPGAVPEQSTPPPPGPDPRGPG
jgi:hypothetical protein